MNSRTNNYQFRVTGIEAKKGTINATDLKNTLDAIIVSCERTLRLLVSGDSVESGNKPAWLSKSIQFNVTGLSEGSTIIELDAPHLSLSIPDYLNQSDFWLSKPQPEDTAIDVFSDAIEELSSTDNAGSDRIDAGVLDGILRFQRIVSNDNVNIEISSKDRSRKLLLSKKQLTKAAELKRLIPDPIAFTVSGHLNSIEHSHKKFKLDLSDGKYLIGVINQEFISLETLRKYWGEKVTMKGKVFFKPNLTPRLLEAELIKPLETGEEIFDRTPTPTDTLELFPEITALESSSNDLSQLWGAWPGDESVSDLLLALNE